MIKDEMLTMMYTYNSQLLIVANEKETRICLTKKLETKIKLITKNIIDALLLEEKV